MSLEYALVTSSSLPSKVKESASYLSVDKAQWLDLVDYSQDLVEQNPEQRVLFLIVAKGTPEQEAEDAAREEEALAAHEAVTNAQEADAVKKLEEERLARESAAAQKELRNKSKSIFNALYRR